MTFTYTRWPNFLNTYFVNLGKKIIDRSNCSFFEGAEIIFD